MNKIFVKEVIAVFLLLFIISCTNVEYVKEDFYDNGEVKEKAYLYSSKDTIPYKIIHYYEDGSVKDTLFYSSKGELNGICYYFDKKLEKTKNVYYIEGVRIYTAVYYSDGKRLNQHSKGEEIIGKQYIFNKQGNVLYEMFWINGKPVAEKDVVCFYPGDTLKNVLVDNKGQHTSINIEVDTTVTHVYSLLSERNDGKANKRTIGTLTFKEGLIDTSMYHSYHHVLMKDTIKYGELLEISFKGYYGKFNSNVHLELLLGEMNSDLTFLDKIIRYKTNKGDLDIQFTLDKYKKGYNVLTGIVNLMRDTVLVRQALFFEDFYVVD
jgi:hypothetical protein